MISGSNALTNVDAHLAAAGSVTGVVTKTGGTPVAGVTVRAFGPSDTFFPSASAVSAANGTYTIHGLAPGTYNVSFAPTAASGLGTEWFNNAATRAAATAVIVIAGGSTAVNDEVSGATVISGTVTDTHSNPLAGVIVRVYLPTDGAAASFITTTAADGTYSVVATAPASYKVNFQSPGYVGQWFNAKATRALATSITASPGVPMPNVNAALVSTP